MAIGDGDLSTRTTSQTNAGLAAGDLFYCMDISAVGDARDTKLPLSEMDLRWAPLSHVHAAADITSGTLVHEQGGLEADVSAYSGLVGINAGATSEIDTVAEFNSMIGDLTGLPDTANGLDQFAATTSAELLGVISDETGTGLLVFATSPTFTTPLLGTPTSGDLANCTGYEGTAIASTGEVGGTKFLREDGDGTSSWQAIAGGGDALVANPLSQFAATTSLQLAGVISDETGSGSLVFGTSPTLVTPALGTPASGVATNLTGTAAGLTAGTVTTNANLTGHVTSTGNAAVLGSFSLAQLNTAINDGTVDPAGTDNSTDVTLAGTGTYISIVGQVITVDAITESDITDLGAYITATSSETLTNKTIDGDDNTFNDVPVTVTCRKGSAGTITKVTPVYISGYNASGWVEVEEADADGVGTMPCIGLATESITNGADAQVIISGKLGGVDTSSWSVGDELFVSTTVGTLQNSNPGGDVKRQKVAQVLRSHASQGVVMVFGAGRAAAIPNVLSFVDITADPDAAGELQRNGNNLMWHNGSAAVQLNEQAAGGGLTYNTVSADADQAMAVNNAYNVDMSGWASGNIFSLPTTAAVGDRVQVTIKTGSATQELQIRTTAASNDTIHGTDYDSADFTKLFITGESMTFVCLTANTDWAVESDKRIPCTAKVSLSTADAVTTSTDTFIEFNVEDFDTGDIGTASNDTAAGCTARRAGRWQVTAFTALSSLGDGARIRTIIWNGAAVKSTQVNNGAAQTGTSEANDIVVVADGDLVQVKVNHNHGSDRSLTGTSASFEPHLVVTEIIPGQ